MYWECIMGNYLGNSETMTTEEASDILGIFWILLILVNWVCKARVSKARVPAQSALNFLNPKSHNGSCWHV